MRHAGCVYDLQENHECKLMLNADCVERGALRGFQDRRLELLTSVTSMALLY